MLPLLTLEIQLFLRDTKTIIFSIILPVLLMPVLFNFTQMVQPNKKAPRRKVAFSYYVSGKEQQLVSGLLDQRPDIFRRAIGPEVDQEGLREGKIDLYIRTADTSVTSTDLSPTDKIPGSRGQTLMNVRFFQERSEHHPHLEVSFLADKDRSLMAQQNLVDLLKDRARQYRDVILTSKGLPRPPSLPKFRDTAPSGQAHSSKILPLICVMLTFLILGGASVAALDTIAGERERGTFETLLTSRIPISTIALAKWTAVTLLSLGISAFELTCLFVFAKIGWISAPEILQLQLSPATIVLACGLSVVLALFLSALLVYISASNQNFKAAQMSLFPVMLISMALVMAGSLEELRLDGFFALVPLSGLSIGFREVLTWDSEHPIHWIGLGLTVIVHLGLTFGLLQRIVRLLAPEAESDEARVSSLVEQRREDLRKEVPWAYALALASILVVPSNFPILMSLEGQVLWNQGLMLAIPAFLLWRQGIPLREGLRLRSCHVKFFLVALAMGPLLQMAANSAAIATAQFLPIPEEMVKQMTQMLLPEGANPLKLLLLLALSPAICEEVAFRGVLVYSLSRWGERKQTTRQRLQISILVGLIFGFFHLSLARILPTAIAGFWITWLALSSGSLLPGILLHFLNNSEAVVAHLNHIDLASFPLWVWPLSWLGLILLGILMERWHTAEPPHEEGRVDTMANNLKP